MIKRKETSVSDKTYGLSTQLHSLVLNTNPTRVKKRESQNKCLRSPVDFDFHQVIRFDEVTND